MRMFSTRKPRGFHHTYIYYDERRASLDAVEQRAARDVGLSADGAGKHARRLNGAFSPTVRRGMARRQPLRGVSLAVLLVVLLAAMIVLTM